MLMPLNVKINGRLTKIKFKKIGIYVIVFVFIHCKKSTKDLTLFCCNCRYIQTCLHSNKYLSHCYIFTNKIVLMFDIFRRKLEDASLKSDECWDNDSYENTTILFDPKGWYY